jgi:hypothetical protein
MRPQIGFSIVKLVSFFIVGVLCGEAPDLNDSSCF